MANDNDYGFVKFRSTGRVEHESSASTTPEAQAGEYPVRVSGDAETRDEERVEI